MTIITHQYGLRILVDPEDRSRANSEPVKTQMTAEDIKKYGPIVGQGKKAVRLDTGLKIQERTQKPAGMKIIKKLTKELLEVELKTKTEDEISAEYGYLVNAVKALASRWKVV